MSDEAHRSAMARPIDRASFLPRDQAMREAARARRNRRHLLLTVGVLAVLITARLVLRFLGVIA